MKKLKKVKSLKKMRKRNKGLILLTLLLLVTCLIKQGPGLGELALKGEHLQVSASRAPEDLSISLSYGYNTYAKHGRYMPISAEVLSANSDFNGWFEVRIPFVEDNIVCRKEVSAVQGESTKVDMTIPLIGGYGRIEIKLINNKGDILYESLEPIKLGNYEKIIFAALLTDDQETLSYLNNLAIKTFPLDEDTFPREYDYLDNIDVIIINNFDTSLLSDKQVEVLKQWILSGGSLILGSGENGDKTIGALANEFGIAMFTDANKEIPYDKAKLQLNSTALSAYINESNIEELKLAILRFEEERNLLRNYITDRNKQLRNNGLPTIPMEEIKQEDWPSETMEDYSIPKSEKEVANLKFTDEKAIQNPFFQRKELGKGNILLYEFDLASPLEATFEHTIIINIISNISDAKKIHMENETNGSSVGSPITSSMSYTATENIPKVGKYLVILLIYITLIGPASYFILHKKKKYGNVWIVVPSLSIIFTFIIYLAGGDTRVDNPFVGYVEVRTYKSNDTIEDELYFSLTAPYNDKYKVEISPHYPITGMVSSGYEFPMYNQTYVRIDPDKYKAAINYGLDKTTLEINNNPAFRPVFFQSKNEYIGRNPIEADIKYTGDKIEGIITNTSKNTLSNVIYVGDGFVFNIGTIRAGQSINLTDSQNTFINDKKEIYNSELVNYIVPGDRVSAIRKREILYYLLDRYISSGSQENCIIGFASESKVNAFIAEMSEEFDVYGTKAVIANVSVDYTEGNKTFVPNISHLVKSEDFNTYSIKSRTKYSDFVTGVISEEETIIEYYLPEDDKVLSVDYYALSNQIPLSYYNMAFRGNIYALNRTTGNFDHIFAINNSINEDKKIIDRSNLSKYLSKNNELTLKYEADISQYESVMLLPNISYWKDGD